MSDSSAESGETVPTGLAAAILAERAGSLLSERMTIRLGDSLPQLGDAIVETEGTVYLQSFEVDCSTLTADLRFGVPDHLSQEDMASLLSGFRNKRTAESATIRKTGKPEDSGAKVELGGIPPLSSTEFAPGNKAKTTIAGSTRSAAGSIVLDTTSGPPKLVITDGTNTVSIDLADVAEDCAGTYSLHKLKYKDRNGDTQIYHGIFCADIDLSDMQSSGKTIKDVQVIPSELFTTVTFIYTDDSSTTIQIPHGNKGKKGDKGDDGEAPEITAFKSNGVTSVFADGELIAEIVDGHTPVITADKLDGVTTIYVDGTAVAQIEDGGETQYDSVTCISGLRFEISDGVLKAIISKSSFYVPDSFNMHPVETQDAEEVTVCYVGELDVVTEEAYSSSTHQFTNTRKRIKVIGDATDAVGQTPFTATPLTGG